MVWWFDLIKFHINCFIVIVYGIYVFRFSEGYADIILATTGPSKSKTVVEKDDDLTPIGSKSRISVETDYYLTPIGSKSKNSVEKDYYLTPICSKSKNTVEKDNYLTPIGSKSNKEAEKDYYLTPIGSNREWEMIFVCVCISLNTFNWFNRMIISVANIIS